MTKGPEMDTFDRIRGEIGERLDFIRPLIEEYRRLEAALDALGGPLSAPEPEALPELAVVGAEPGTRRARRPSWTVEQVRDLGRSLGRFNLARLVEASGASRSSISAAVAELTERGTFERRGPTRGPAVYWLFVKPTASAATGERDEREPGWQRQGVAGIGRGKGPSDKAGKVPHPTRRQGPGKPEEEAAVA